MLDHPIFRTKAQGLRAKDQNLRAGAHDLRAQAPNLRAKAQNLRAEAYDLRTSNRRAKARHPAPGTPGTPGTPSAARQPGAKAPTLLDIPTFRAKGPELKSTGRDRRAKAQSIRTKAKD